MTHPLHQFKYCPKCGSKQFVENNFKSKRCEDCDFIYYFNSSASTVALIVNEKHELLIATRAHEPAQGTLDLPGGFVDMNETGEEAVIREVKEETNLDVLDARYMFSIVNYYTYSDFEVHTLDLVYHCTIKDDKTLKAEDDVSNLEFIKISDLKPEQFGLNSVRRIIEKIQKESII